ncbi:MAG: polyprenyl synthetase family protein [Planctomycetota bacterium]|jgi:geranylgeranyl pyrophosphate synthase
MSSPVETDSIAVRLGRWAERFDRRLAELVHPADEGTAPPQRLAEAMRYTLLAPGKRLRPYLVCRCCALAGGSEEAAIPVAAAVECVHAFSLIHDDLPAMDDDEVRRGQPSCHVRYDEATAILAGDALLALAFELIAAHAPDDRRASALTLELARAVGAGGMIGGQAADIEGEGMPPHRETVEYIHRHKTARLFESACRCGAILADTDQETTEALAAYGAHLGRAFQIVDDLLDATSPVGRLGKEAGKGTEADKQTFPRCVGIEESRRIAASGTQKALQVLRRFGPEAEDLAELARYVLQRQR